ncbi:MAG: transporter substrate-binding protein [Modestobacter sp.]|jgi:iron(III) transport system substrate-binding protein|nr:transporter substrate-binding protein [Modestobacter sp.]
MTTGSVGQPAGSRSRSLALAAVGVLSLAACGGVNGDAAPSQTVTLYTCVSDDTIQPVIQAFEKGRPGSRIDLFRAPTGELNARVAADVRSGGLRADVVWGCDPLTVQALVDQGLVGGWTPPDSDAIPGEYRTDDYVGAAVLYMVAVHRTDVPAPRTWSDLTGPGYTDAVAVPDPSVAASALGALGWFAEDPDYGVRFYADLRSNGAVQVSTPDDVTTGVAQGIYAAGLTTANSAYAAKGDGSPVDVVWPDPGAVAIYGPVALATSSADSQAAQDFIAFVVGDDGQRVLGKAGSYPTRPGVAGPALPEGAPIVSPDWATIRKDQEAILSDYRQVFGG